jgi:hypothetical protein
MVARHGWKSKPSPRRGFTVVEASREPTGCPIVLAVRDSVQAVRLFRMAVEEAMGRHRNLVVLDYGTTSLHDALEDESAEISPRERRTLRALQSNPHVRVIRAQPVDSALERTVAYCESTQACLLIIGAEQIGSASIDARLAQRMFNGNFDVLVVTDHE